jgi:hypothetical protein
MRLIGGSAACVFIASAAFAQQPAPSRADLATGFELDIPGEAVDVGFAIAGEVTLAPAAVKRGDVIASAPVVHTQTGVLRTDVTGKRLSLPGGTPVYRAVFAVGFGTSDPVPAWCGRGFRGGERDRRPAVVCVLETPDGRATLARASDTYGRAWSADGMRMNDVDSRVDRPKVEVGTASPFGAMRVEFRYHDVDEFQISLGRSIVGPGAEPDEERRSLMGQVNASWRDGVARVPFGSVSLELRVSEDRRTATASWGPPVEVAAATAASKEEDAPTAPTSFTYGAVRLDVDSFTFTEGPVGENQVLARGKGVRRKVRRADEAARVQTFLAGMLKERVEAGAIFHEVEFYEKNGLGMWGREVTWCGPFDINTVRGPDVVVRCLVKPAPGDTYQVFHANPAKPWLSGARYVTFAGQSSIQLRLSDVAEDPLGPFDVLIGVSDFSRGYVHLGAVARRDGENVHFWSARARFNEAGEARFPFWDRTLVVRRAGEKTITGAFESGGDGAGFYGFDGLLPASGDLRLP